jgi:sugar lactone lactonase YvrE
MVAAFARHREARCVWAAGAALGEGPVWLGEEAALYWVDIQRGTLCRYRPLLGCGETCAMPQPMTSLAPMTDGRLLLTSHRDLYVMDTRAGHLLRVRTLETTAATVRINDGSCHADGAFWFGTMDLAEHAPLGDFYRLAADGACERFTARFAITNGPAFAPDGHCGYFVDSARRRILHAPMHGGRLAAPLRLFVQFEPNEGFPDGLAIDADGGVWCAHWGGGRVTRFDVDGQVSDVIALPVSNVTKCAFGGQHLDRLFITTARKDLDASTLAAQPLAGGLFEVEVAHRGVPAARYAGNPEGDGASCTCVFEPS